MGASLSGRWPRGAGAAASPARPGAAGLRRSAPCGVPSEPLTSTTSPAAARASTAGIRLCGIGRMARRAAPPAGRAARSFISGPQVNTRSTPAATSGAASSACRRGGLRRPAPACRPARRCAGRRARARRWPARRRRRASRPGWRCSSRRSARACRRAARCCRRWPRPLGGLSAASAPAARPISRPSAATAASTARLFCTQCRPGRAQPVVDAPAEDLGRDRAARRPPAGNRSGGSRRPACSPKPRMRVMPCRRAWRGQPLEMRIVAVEHGGAVRAHALEDLRLGVGDRFDRGEEPEMRRLDGGDDGDIGPDHARERADLAGMVHAELEHAERGARAAGARATAARPSDC